MARLGPADRVLFTLPRWQELTGWDAAGPPGNPSAPVNVVLIVAPGRRGWIRATSDHRSAWHSR